MINYAFEGSVSTSKITRTRISLFRNLTLTDLYDLLEELSDYKKSFQQLASSLTEQTATLSKTLGLYHAKKCAEVDLDAQLENLGTDVALF